MENKDWIKSKEARDLNKRLKKKQTLNQYIEEKMPLIKKVLIILVILALVSSVLLFSPLSKPTLPYPNPTNLTQCKLNAWVSCGLEIDDDMCWKLKINNNTRWENCQIVKNKTANCFVNQSAFCKINFVNTLNGS